jgi:hypothetical protein
MQWVPKAAGVDVLGVCVRTGRIEEGAALRAARHDVGCGVVYCGVMGCPTGVPDCDHSVDQGRERSAEDFFRRPVYSLLKSPTLVNS